MYVLAPSEALLIQILKTIGIVLGSGGGITILAKYLIERKRKKKVDKHVNGLRDLVLIYEILNDIIAGTSAARALIIKSSNGGGIPRPDKQVIVTVMNEVYVPPFEKPSRKWHARPADEQYSKLLLDLVRKKRVHLETKELPGNCDLKTHYLADNVASSDVFLIHMNSEEMIYLSLNYPEACVLGPQGEAMVRNRVNDLRLVYEKYRDQSSHNPLAELDREPQ